jgi:hypothetical protein
MSTPSPVPPHISPSRHSACRSTTSGKASVAAQTENILLRLRKFKAPQLHRQPPRARPDARSTATGASLFRYQVDNIAVSSPTGTRLSMLVTLSNTTRGQEHRPSMAKLGITTAGTVMVRVTAMSCGQAEA